MTTTKQKRKTLADFEQQHGGRKIAALEGALKAQAEERDIMRKP